MKKELTTKSPPAHRVLGAITAAVLVMALGGCMVGPDYKRPPAEVNDSWLESSQTILDEPAEIREWWTSFNDPVMTALVNKAYEQNLTLRAAGLRVIRPEPHAALQLVSSSPRNRESVLTTANIGSVIATGTIPRFTVSKPLA